MFPDPPASGTSYDPRSDWTSDPTIAIDPCLCLMPVTRLSFAVNDLNRLAQWLQAAGWRSYPGNSKYEHSRLMRGRQLVVLYWKGSVLVQGARPEETLQLLGRLPQASTFAELQQMRCSQEPSGGQQLSMLDEMVQEAML